MCPCVLGSLASVMYVRKVDLVVRMKGYVSASHILYSTCRLPYLDGTEVENMEVIMNDWLYLVTMRKHLAALLG